MTDVVEAMASLPAALALDYVAKRAHVVVADLGLMIERKDQCILIGNDHEWLCRVDALVAPSTIGGVLQFVSPPEPRGHLRLVPASSPCSRLYDAVHTKLADIVSSVSLYFSPGELDAILASMPLLQIFALAIQDPC